jgi:hypothetical protein
MSKKPDIKNTRISAKSIKNKTVNRIVLGGSYKKKKRKIL